MANIKFKDNPIHTTGELPAVGSDLPDFVLVKNDLSETRLSDYKGKTLILNIFVSLDTGTCAASTKRFNKEAANLKDTAILCVSHDLPFAHGRFCTAEGIENLTTVSVFRSPEFGMKYGLLMTDGPLKGLLSRAVVIADENGKVIYTEQVQEVTSEPNYEAALAKVK